MAVSARVTVLRPNDAALSPAISAKGDKPAGTTKEDTSLFSGSSDFANPNPECKLTNNLQTHAAEKKQK